MIKEYIETIEAILAVKNIGTILLFFCMFVVVVGIFSFTSNQYKSVGPINFKKDENLKSNIFFDKADIKAIYYDNNDGIPESVIYTYPIDMRIEINTIGADSSNVNAITLIKRN